MTIEQITAVRAEEVGKLAAGLDQAAAAFKALEIATCALADEVYRLSHTPGSNRPYVSPLQGMEMLRERVQLIVENTFYAACDDKNINLTEIVSAENTKALSLEASNG